MFFSAILKELRSKKFFGSSAVIFFTTGAMSSTIFGPGLVGASKSFKAPSPGTEAPAAAPAIFLTASLLPTSVGSCADFLARFCMNLFTGIANALVNG